MGKNSSVSLRCHAGIVGRRHRWVRPEHMHEDRLGLIADVLVRIGCRQPGLLAPEVIPNRQAHRVPGGFPVAPMTDPQFFRLEGNIPNLRINKSYLNMLEKYRDKEGSKEKRDVISFVKYKLKFFSTFRPISYYANIWKMPEPPL